MQEDKKYEFLANYSEFKLYNVVINNIRLYRTTFPHGEEPAIENIIVFS